VAPRKLSEHDVKKLRSRSPISGVPVLLYHRLSKSRTRTLDSRKARYEIPFSDFRSHLERIRQGGYRILSVPEVRDESLRSSKGPAVGITFDDGFASDYEEAFLRRELNTSRNLLEDQLGSSVEFIAAPYGLVNRRVIHEALAAGYRGVCRSRQWPARPGNKCINRVTVYRRTSPEEFDDLLTCRPGPYIRRLMRSVVIYCPKKLLVRFQPKLVGVIVQEEPT
jgi:peptidoglycan/xylan/chitin deacetylase (PgdA/CDA1 family)